MKDDFITEGATMTTGTKRSFDAADLLVEIHSRVAVLTSRTECLEKLKEDSDGMRKVLFGVNGSDGLLRELKAQLAEQKKQTERFIAINEAEHLRLHSRISEQKDARHNERMRAATLRGEWKGITLAVGALLGLADFLFTAWEHLHNFIKR